MGKDSNHRGSQPLKTRFARLDHDLLRSAAYSSLSPNGRALLVEFAMMYNQRNNGSLYLSVRDAAARMGVADLTAASAAMGELMDMGFIEMTAEGVFSSSADKPSKARCWRLTWADAPGQSPTHAYREAVVRGARPARRAKEGRLALDRHASEKNRGAKTNTVTSITVSDYNTDAGNYRPDDAPTVLETNTPKQQKRLIPVDVDRSAIRHTSSVATTGAPAKPAGIPQSKLQIAGGPISASDIDRLRDELRSFVSGAGYGAQKRICDASSVAPSVLSRFRSGKSLPEGAFVPLRLALVQLTGERKAA
jgi:hypothetical protein